MTTELVTVVVATRDRCDQLRASLARHQHPVVLVDNGSSDGTPDMVQEEFPDVQVVRLPCNRGATARNVGVELAATPYVAFADDDSWWAPGALDRAVSHFEAAPRLAVLAARILVGPQERPDPVCQEMADSPLGRADDLPGPSVLGFLACGAVARRSAFLEAKGFDDLIFFFGEEELLSLDLMAAGWGLAYVDEVVAHHHPAPSRGPSPARAALGARNRVLTALMRRPWPTVATTVGKELRAGGPRAQGVAHALPRTPRALARRQLLPPHVEAARLLLSGGAAR